MRGRAILGAIVAAVALALLLGACGGGDGGVKTTTTTSPPALVPPSGGGAPSPPASPGQLPPRFLKCMKDRGYEVKSPDEIHSAPPQVLQACFGALHGG